MFENVARRLCRAAAAGYLAGVVVGDALVDFLDLDPPVVQCIRQVLGDVLDLERQRFAVHVGAHPAHRHVGVSAFRQDQFLRPDLDGRVDQLHAGFLLPVDVARQHAEVGRFEAVGAEGPGLAGRIQDLRRGRHRFGILLDLYG